MAGKVYLIGAGPSDPGLFTIKGQDVLSKAEVVVYDSLVGPGILAMIPSDAEKIDVGKRAGNHTMVQEEINKVLLNKALEGKLVVRLKGGDPFLFGRGGEELELLTENNIPYEVVPGVTSAISVPAYNGIPVTHRDAVSSVHIITGHKKKNEPYNIDFKALTDTKGTLVFLMGVAALPDIMDGLLKAGMSPDMPAAILSKGTSAGQNRIVATVGTLPEEVRVKGIATPAIIVVGQVCKYSEDFGWYEKLPLFGKRLIVTRPKDRAGVFSSKLRSKGAEVIEIPAIETVRRELNDQIREAFDRLADYDYMVFTSPAGVKCFVELLIESGKDLRALGKAKIAVIGQGTAKELKNYGLIADMMPEIYDGIHLGMLLAGECKAASRILIPRASIGSKELIDELNKIEDVEITDLPIYDTIYQDAGVVNLKKYIETEENTIVAFTSASTVKGFFELAKDVDMSKVRAACIGKQTAAAALEYGMDISVADKATMDAMVELIEKM